jgi:uncharacterized membrane protein
MTRSNPSPDDEGRQDPDRPFFSARLTPYRSLTPRGFMILMILVGAVSFAAGLVFMMIGAWPVMGFFGLDVLIIYAAFRMSFGQARASEDVHVSVTDVHVVRTGPRGAVQEFHLNPAWARLEVRRIEDEGVVALALVSHGRSVTVGGFLNPADRESFAAALGRALATARRGGPAALGAA